MCFSHWMMRGAVAVDGEEREREREVRERNGREIFEEREKCVIFSAVNKRRGAGS